MILIKPGMGVISYHIMIEPWEYFDSRTVQKRLKLEDNYQNFTISDQSLVIRIPSL